MLDTNVLLSHLKLISELKDFPIEGEKNEDDNTVITYLPVYRVHHV